MSGCIDCRLQASFLFPLEVMSLYLPHAAYRSLLCMQYLSRPVARAGEFKEFQLNPPKELTAMQHLAVSQRKAGVEACMDTESSTSAEKKT